jgi:Asp-tRNA(Asn)/Glu-tRNA(Gln) amidotransferase A subunit family amidase
MPLSLQLIGRHFEEALLCRAAHAFECATPWKDRHPPV